MKMKNFAVLLLTVGMLAGLLAGCGGNNRQETSDQQKKTASQTGETVTSSGVTQDTPAESGITSGTEQSSLTAPSSQTAEAGQVSGTEENSSSLPTTSWIRVWGPVLFVGEDSITIDNRSECGSRGEIVLLLDPENTLLLDGENGYPVEMSELEVDDPVFAYIGYTMTLSIPAQVNAEVIFCDIPDDLRVPEYVRVTQMEQQSDGSYLMTTDSQTQYLVPENCEILPYLTRNLVTLADVQSDSTCLVWCDEKLTVKKIVLFAQ